MYYSMALIFAILFSFIIAWFIAMPFLTGDALTSEGGFFTQDALSDQKARFVQMLRDLELDYATSKVSLSDYEQTKYDLSVQLAEILKKLETRDNA